MENQLIILASVLLGFLMGRFKGSTDDIGKGIQNGLYDAFEGVRRIRFKAKKEEEPSPWA